MYRTWTIIALTFSLLTARAFAHGEDKPGPHGGFIRMPGAFHTEVVPVNKREIKVYLLDIEWKNPSIQRSKVQVEMNKIVKECSPQSEPYFVCSFSPKVDLTKKGSLKIKAQREGQIGNEVIYELPLKLQVIDDGHGGKH